MYDRQPLHPKIRYSMVRAGYKDYSEKKEFFFGKFGNTFVNIIETILDRFSYDLIKRTNYYRMLTEGLRIEDITIRHYKKKKGFTREALERQNFFVSTLFIIFFLGMIFLIFSFFIYILLSKVLIEIMIQVWKSIINIFN